MACIATWSFGLQAVCKAQSLIEAGGDCVDVLEEAINGICSSLTEVSMNSLVNVSSLSCGR